MAVNARRITCRRAAIGDRSGGAWAISLIRSGSYSSSITTSSLVLKYRKNVLGEISAAAAIWSTVVCSYPCSWNSRNACSWISQRVFCFLRSRNPGELMCRFFLARGGLHIAGRPRPQEHRRQHGADHGHGRADEQYPVHRVQVRVLSADEDGEVTGPGGVRPGGWQRLAARLGRLRGVGTGEHAAQDRHAQGAADLAHGHGQRAAGP